MKCSGCSLRRTADSPCEQGVRNHQRAISALLRVGEKTAKKKKTLRRLTMATSNIVITNEIKGKNKGEITRWYTRDQLESLVQVADPADLLEMACLTYKHYLIYAGVEKSSTGEEEHSVVHYDTELQVGFLGDKSTAQIRKQSLTQVLYGNKKVRINNALDRRTCLISPAANISLVNQRINEFVKEKKSYHMCHRNCEHFANFCRYGGKISNQSRIIWVMIVILCLDGLLRLDSAPTVILLRRAAKFGVLAQYLFAWLAYALAAMHVVDLLAAFCMMFSFVKNTLFSFPHIMRTCALILMTLTAYFTEDPAEASKMELGYGASWTGFGLGAFLFALHCGLSPVPLLNQFSCIVGVTVPMWVLGLNVAATLALMMFVYELIRLSNLDTTNNLDFLNFTIAVCYLVRAFDVVFPIFLVLTIIVDDTIRLYFAVHQGKLNGIAFILVFVYLIFVFDWLHTIILISCCIVELCYTEIYTIILGDGSEWNFSGWKVMHSDSLAYLWNYFPKKYAVLIVTVFVLMCVVIVSQSNARHE